MRLIKKYQTSKAAFSKTALCRHLFHYARKNNFWFMLSLPESVCIYHFPIGLKPKRFLFGAPNQLENGKHNLIPVSWTIIRSINICECVFWIFFSFQFCILSFLFSYDLHCFFLFFHFLYPFIFHTWLLSSNSDHLVQITEEYFLIKTKI